MSIMIHSLPERGSDSASSTAGRLLMLKNDVCDFVFRLNVSLTKPSVFAVNNAVYSILSKSKTVCFCCCQHFLSHFLLFLSHKVTPVDSDLKPALAVSVRIIPLHILYFYNRIIQVSHTQAPTGCAITTAVIYSTVWIELYSMLLTLFHHPTHTHTHTNTATGPFRCRCADSNVLQTGWAVHIFISVCVCTVCQMAVPAVRPHD